MGAAFRNWIKSTGAAPEPRGRIYLVGMLDGRNAMKYQVVLMAVAVAVAALAGAGLAWVLDPAQGRSRRARTRDRSAGAVRHGLRRSRRGLRRVRSQSGGLTRRAWHGMQPHHDGYVDDVTLVHRVESEVYRGEDVPKGSLNIDAFDGTVVLRGAVDDPEQIPHLESRVRKVHGVRRVESLLHLQGTPAPNKADALAAGRYREQPFGGGIDL